MSVALPESILISHLPDLDGVVSQEVVHNHLSLVTKHVFRVVPVAEEAQHVTIVIQELFERVVLLVRPQWLHALIHLHIEHSFK